MTDIVDGRCECKTTRLCKRTFANGTEHFGHQCLTCGTFRSVKKSSLKFDSWHEAMSIPDYDDSIPTQWSQMHRDYWAQRRDAEQRERHAKYSAYMKSTEWQIRRKLVLERDNHTCLAVLPGCRRVATQAHHKTYEHLFDEPLWELISICDSCHERLHANERGPIIRSGAA